MAVELKEAAQKADEILREQETKSEQVDLLQVEVQEAPASEEREPETVEPRSVAREDDAGFGEAVRAVERELRRLTSYGRASSQHAQTRPRSMVSMAQTLPQDVRAVVMDFVPVRNRWVHGEILPADVLMPAVRLGEKLLDVLKHLFVVVHPNLVLYKDSAGRQPHSDVHGVMLEAYSDAEDVYERRVFPTGLDYRPGNIVSVEFDSRRHWQEAWYQDPHTGEFRAAFGYSVEFSGHTR